MSALYQNEDWLVYAEESDECSVSDQKSIIYVIWKKSRLAVLHGEYHFLLSIYAPTLGL